MSTVLVVADQPEIRQRLCHIYLQGGYIVVEADDAVAALDMAQTTPIHTAILSLKQPAAALTACSNLTHTLKIPVIYVAHDDSAIDAALDAGAAHVVVDLHSRLLLHCTQTILDAYQTVTQRQLTGALRDTAAILNSTL